MSANRVGGNTGLWQNSRLETMPTTDSDSSSTFIDLGLGDVVVPVFFFFSLQEWWQLPTLPPHASVCDVTIIFCVGC